MSTYYISTLIITLIIFISKEKRPEIHIFFVLTAVSGDGCKGSAAKETSVSHDPKSLGGREICIATLRF